jgi:hypothetical protein
MRQDYLHHLRSFQLADFMNKRVRQAAFQGLWRACNGVQWSGLFTFLRGVLAQRAMTSIVVSHNGNEISYLPCLPADVRKMAWSVRRLPHSARSRPTTLPKEEQVGTPAAHTQARSVTATGAASGSARCFD